jgi:peptide/nickel transport system substrate-binding protein
MRKKEGFFMKRYVFLFCLLLALMPALAPAQGSPNAQSSDALVWSFAGGDVSTLNPALATDQASGYGTDAIYDGLFVADPTTGLPTPALATWEISDDGLKYTFTFKEGVVWSDGTPITSADAKFTYDAIMSDKVESPRKADMASIASIDIVDDRTFVVTLTAPNCTIWGNAFAALIPLPAYKYAADFSDFMTSDFNTAPDVGSGPYLFEERSPGEYVRFKANPTYYLGQPKIPTFILRILADPATVNQALQTATIDYAFMYPDQLEQLPDQEMFNTFLYPNNNAPMVLMNYQDPENPQPAYDENGNLNTLVPNKFFADLRVRQAVAMGYDKAALTLTLGENSGSVQLTGPVTPAFYSTYDMSSIQPWPYDPEQAKQLLDEAGWVDTNGNGIRDKDGVEFEVDLAYSPLVDLWGNIAAVLQDQLGQIGIKVNINSMEWSAYLSEVLLPAKYDMTIVGFGGGTEVDGIAYNLLYSKNAIPNGGFNLVSYVNPEMDKLLDEARTLPGCPVAERVKLYQQIQQIARDDVPYDWTVSTTQVHVLNKRVIDAFIGQWDSTPPVSVTEWSLGQ